MLKMMLSSCRHPSFTRDRFFQYLRDTHAPLVLRTPELLKYLRCYVQNHTVLPEDGVTAKTFYRRASERDSVIELWFDGHEGLANAMNEPRYLELIRPDEAKFNDLTKLVGALTVEKPVFDGPRPRFKAFDFIKRRPGIALEEFVEKWDQHGNRLAADPQYRGLVAKRTHNLAVHNVSDAFAPAPAFDAVAELWIDDFSVLDRLLAGGFSSEEDFVDPVASFSVLATEVPIYNQTGQPPVPPSD